jgi:DnaJ-class molecular chaperone
MLKLIAAIFGTAILCLAVTGIRTSYRDAVTTRINQKAPCFICGGAGEVKCMTCFGRGESLKAENITLSLMESNSKIDTGPEPCSACNGSGMHECKACDGFGR